MSQEELQTRIDELGEEGYQIVDAGKELFKVVKDGKTAVAITRGYGTGWSSANRVNPMDAEFNVLFLLGETKEIERLCEQRHISASIRNVVIEWVAIGEQFMIDEYDGSEGITYINELKWLSA